MSSDKIRLLKIAISKVSNDKNYIAYFLEEYIKIEQTSEENIISDLKCSLEDYYKLSLCKISEINSTEFLSDLNAISSYIKIPILELNRIIKRVEAINKLSSSNFVDGNLMAARDKGKKDLENE